MSWRHYFLSLALVGLVVLPVAQGAEAEIYVTTGPDGIEMFSNLPRERVMQAGLPGATLKDRAVVVSSTMPAHQPRHVMEAAGGQETTYLSPEILAAGKSFLLDD